MHAGEPRVVCALRRRNSEALVRNAIAFSMMALGRVSLVDCAQVLLQLFAGDLRRVGVLHRVGVLVVIALRIV